MPGKGGGEAPVRSIFSTRWGSEKQYFDMIDRAFATRNERIIRNGEPAHAVYLICKFLDTAQRKILVSTGHLSREFGGVRAWAEPKLADAAKRFLAEREGHLRIVITDSPDVDEGQSIADHPFLRALSDAETGDGYVVVYHHGASSSLPHYITMDDEALRIEVDPDNAKAYVNLNDPKTCEVLQGIFESQAEKGERLFTIQPS